GRERLRAVAAEDVAARYPHGRRVRAADAGTDEVRRAGRSVAGRKRAWRIADSADRGLRRAALSDPKSESAADAETFDGGARIDAEGLVESVWVERNYFGSVSREESDQQGSGKKAGDIFSCERGTIYLRWRIV